MLKTFKLNSKKSEKQRNQSIIGLTPKKLKLKVTEDGFMKIEK
jgi:hypothetical protein